jgi:hypothetical protein
VCPRTDRRIIGPEALLRSGGKAPSAAGLAGRVGRRSGDRGSLVSRDEIVGDFDNGVSARLADVFAGFDALFAEALALGNAHSFYGRLVVVGGQVARNRSCRDFFAEKAQTQCMHRAALIDSSDRI